AAPSLWTMNGFGFRLYGKTQVDPATGSYMTTYYFVALFIPLIPICRYRVKDAGNNSYSFLGKAPLRKFDRWQLALVVLGLIGFIAFNQQDNGSVSSSSISSTPFVQPQHQSVTASNEKNEN